MSLTARELTAEVSPQAIEPTDDTAELPAESNSDWDNFGFNPEKISEFITLRYRT